MISFMIKYKKVFLILTIAFFLGSLGFLGAGVFMEEFGPNAAVAKVGDAKIKYGTYDLLARNIEQQMSQQAEAGFTDEMRAQIRREVLQQMINEESLWQAAVKFGLGVSNLEVAYTIRNSPMFNQGGGFDKRIYTWIVRNNFGLNPAEYEFDVKKKKASAKFENMIVLAAKVTPQEAEILSRADKDAAKLYKDDKAQFTFGLIQLKAQSLMDKFTQQFNAENKVEIIGQGI